MLFLSRYILWNWLVVLSLLTGTAAANVIVNRDYATDPPRIRALIVGAGEFMDKTLPMSNDPRNDVNRLYSALDNLGRSGRAKIDYITKLIDTNASKNGIISEWKKLLSSSKSDDTVIFYWSGHTVADSIKGTVFLVPFDADIGGSKEDNIEPRSRGAQVIPDPVRYEKLVDIRRELVDSIPDNSHVVLIIDGCNIGDGYLSDIFRKYPYLSILSSAKEDELALWSSNFTSIISDIINDPFDDLDGDGRLSLEELWVQLYPKFVKDAHTIHQHPSLAGLYTHRTYLATAQLPVSFPASNIVDGGVMHSLKLDPRILGTLSFDAIVSINDKWVDPKKISVNAGELKYLGGSVDIFSNGINVIETTRSKFRVWRAEQSLKSFTEPYKNARAILVAIDDYDRADDVLHRGSTGYPELSGMKSLAMKLKDVLIARGIPKENISEFYDEKATSQNIESEIEKYWQGSEYADADMLFFYFGGHGEKLDNDTMLITYDYDQRAPTRSTLQGRDLVERHARNVQAKHMLVALDACASGLTTERFLGDDNAIPNADIDKSIVIERETSSKARNLLVAGTGDQKAIWQNGGLFTQALIDGLRGNADFYGDGIIEFDELASYVRDTVSKRARLNLVKQDPRGTILTEYGDGEVLFPLR